MICIARPPAGPDKEAFHRVLTDFGAVEHYDALLHRLATCTDVLPAKYAELLFLLLGSTYRDAVMLLLSSWNGPLGGACDWPEQLPGDLEDE